MNNVMLISEHKAVISYAPGVDTFRGEFVGLSGSADFYALDMSGLRREGEQSLKVLLEARSVRHGIEPRKDFSGKFVVRLTAKAHETVTLVSASWRQSINQWVADTLDRAIRT